MDEDDVEFTLRDVRLTPVQALIYLVMGFVVCSTTAWLFASVLDYSIEDTLFVQIPVVLLSVSLVFACYRNTTLLIKLRLIENRRGSILRVKMDKEERKNVELVSSLKRQRKFVTGVESVALCLVLVHAAYVVVMLVFGFYVFKRFQPIINFVLTSLFTPLLLFFISAQKAPQKA